MKNKKTVAINFGPLKSGGGQNVAMNFLISLTNLSEHKLLEKLGFYFIVAEGSALHHMVMDANLKYIVVPRNAILRIFYEALILNWSLKRRNIKVIYSYFGFGLFSKYYFQISGSADSNIYFPEIDFWAEEPISKRYMRYCIDKYRVFGLKRSQAVIFENKKMYERSDEIIGEKLKIYIPPSFSKVVHESPFKLTSNYDSSIKLLFLSGWHTNKNVDLIPYLVHEFIQQKLNVEVYLTATEERSKMCELFVSAAKKLKVEDRIHLVGYLPKNKLSGAYAQSDYVMLLSNLESFSNTIIESWAYGKPLVVSDADWARSICGNAAIYVQNRSCGEIVRAIIQIHNSMVARVELIENGKKKLAEYPNISERTIRELSFVEGILEND
jgi:glycosyltransferase involved in cell wall biosynthesis